MKRNGITLRSPCRYFRRRTFYNEDSGGTVYDAEMENPDHKTAEPHRLPGRSRYYQAAIDIDHMDRGNSCRKLPESNVLFICTFDPFAERMQ